MVHCDDGRSVAASHTLLCIGSIPNSDGLGLDAAGVVVEGGVQAILVNQHCVNNVPHIYAAGDVSASLSVAAMQGRKVAEHVMGLHTREHRHLDYDKAASAIFTEPEIADVAFAETDGCLRRPEGPHHEGAVLGVGQGAINNDPRGFVKLVSDPATGVVLGGSIVGRHAAEPRDRRGRDEPPPRP